MRLLVLSDLHVEHAEFDPPAFEADLVVHAGDIHNGAESLRWARAAFPHHPLVQIAGNHEFYDGEYDETLLQMREAAREFGIHFLENDALVERSDLWIHGHTHTTQAFCVGRSRVACNPRGYPAGVSGARAPDPQRVAAQAPPQAFENPAFAPGLVLEVAVA